MLPRRSVALAAIVALVFAASAPTDAAQRRKRPARRAAEKAPEWPPFEVRHAEWLRRKEGALTTGAPEPDPLLQYLVSEVTVTGVFETEGGQGVFLFAAPTGNTFFARPGAELYNGRLAEIRPAPSGFADHAEIVFVESATRGAAMRPVVKKVEGGPAPQPAAPQPAAPQPAAPQQPGTQPPSSGAGATAPPEGAPERTP